VYSTSLVSYGICQLNVSTALQYLEALFETGRCSSRWSALITTLI